MATTEQLLAGAELARRRGNNELAAELTRRAGGTPVQPGASAASEFSSGAIAGAVSPFEALTRVPGMGALGQEMAETGAFPAGPTAPIPPTSPVDIQGPLTDLGVLDPQAAQAQTLAGGAGRFTGGSLVSGPAALGAGGMRALAMEAGPTVAGAAGAGIGSAVGGPTGELVGGLAGTFAPLGIRGAAVGGVQDEFRRRLGLSNRIGVRSTLGELIPGRRGSIASFTERTFARLPGGNMVARRRALANLNKIGRAVERTADELARRGTPTIAGRAMKSGAEDFVTAFRVRSSNLYKKANEKIVPTAPVQASQTKELVEELLERPEEIREALSKIGPAASERVTGAINDIVQGGATYEGLDAVRKAVGQQLGDSTLIDSAPQVLLKRFYKALSEDQVRAAERAGGPEAARRLKQANKHHSNNIERIERTLDGIARNPDASKAFRSFERSGWLDPTAFRDLKASVPRDKWAVVQSAIMRRLGRAKPSEQDIVEGAGEAFSNETLVTNAAKMIEAKTWRPLLSGKGMTRKHHADLEAVIQAANQMRQTERVLRNTSGTAQAATGGATVLGGGAMAAFGMVPEALLFTGGTIVGSTGVELLMQSKLLTRWLAASMRVPLAQMPAHVSNLANVVEAEPQAAELAAQIAANLRAR